LAKTPLLTLAKAWQNFVLLPVIDGDLFPEDPDEAISNPASGNVKPAPTLMVAVPNPGTYFVNPYVQEALEIGWEELLDYLFGDFVGEYLDGQYSDAVYGNQTEASLFARGSELISDAVWLCPLRRHATFLTAVTPNVFVTTWNTRASFFSFPDEYGIVHGTEVPFLFGNAVDIATEKKKQFTPTEALISKFFISQVSQFVRTGAPGSELPAWTPEVNALINPDNVPTVSQDLFQIRTPPSGLGYPTRCDLFDFFFELSQKGRLDKNKLLETFENHGGNFWGAKPKHTGTTLSNVQQ